MTLDLEDTIAAIASAPGGAARGIVRLSGPLAVNCLAAVFRGDDDGLALSDLRHARCLAGQLSLPGAMGQVPVRLYLWPGQRSYTRQPTGELHLVGSPPILDALLAAVCSAGARLARPGEFTLRAFLAGRLDLTQAEAVLGVIDAQSQRDLTAALAQLAGGLATPLAELRSELLDLLAHLEAGLDFVEEDIEFLAADQLEAHLASATQSLDEIAAKMASRGEADELPRVVLIGETNAGKSSLLNALVQKDAAIVSPQAGTTRNVVTCRAMLDGVECLLVDTAGIDEPADATIAAAAQSQMHAAQAQARLVLVCLDASRQRTPWELRQLESHDLSRRIVVWTKRDLASPSLKADSADAVRTSSRTGSGLEALRSAIARALVADQGETGVVATTAARCRDSVGRAATSLARALAACRGRLGDELVAAEVRGALDELGQVVGAVYTEDVLDRIFSRFCIGK